MHAVVYKKENPEEKTSIKMEKQGGREREKMIKRLYDASVNGSVPSLIQLMEEDRLILDRVTITSFNETPLHIAAMLGHLEFAREILRHKPRLAAELDSESYSPLHLASAEGNLELVKELLKIDSNVCCITDIDGRTPLHLAAIKGRIDVMKELIQARPEVIHARVDKGESILHLCVKYNRLEALKLLLELPSDQELLNSKDDDGNTTLHLVAAKKQKKGMEFLLGMKEVEVNALNGNGLTPLDILAQSPRDIKDLDIGEALRVAGALRARDITNKNDNTNTEMAITTTGNLVFSSPSSTSSDQMQVIPDRNGWLEKKKNSLMVVSTVIATMSYQAMLSPPGGVWQENGNHQDPYNPYSNRTHIAGTSIMADTYPYGYKIFLASNTVSFIASLSITLLLISGLPLRHRVFMWVMMVGMWITITSLVLGYVVSLLQLIPDYQNVTSIIIPAFYVWLGLVGLVLLLHAARMVSRCVSRLPLTCRIFLWILTVLAAIASLEFNFRVLLREKQDVLMTPTILLGVVNLPTAIFSVWLGMVVPVILNHTAGAIFSRLKKGWKAAIKKTGYCPMVNYQNQSTV